MKKQLIALMLSAGLASAAPVKVGWTANAPSDEVSEYIVYVSDDGAAPVAVSVAATSIESHDTDGDGAPEEYVVAILDLAPGSVYTVSVAAQNWVGTSDVSNETTINYNTPRVPENLRVIRK